MRNRSCALAVLCLIVCLPSAGWASSTFPASLVVRLVRKQNPAPPQVSKAEKAKRQKKLVARFVALQRKIEQLERQTLELQRQRDELKTELPPDVLERALAVTPKIAIVVFMSSEIFFARAAKNGFLPGDKVVMVERMDGSAKIVSHGTIVQVYSDEAQGFVDEGRLRPGVEVYIISRDDSPYSLSQARLHDPSLRGIGN